MSTGSGSPIVIMPLEMRFAVFWNFYKGPLLRSDLPDDFSPYAYSSALCWCLENSGLTPSRLGFLGLVQKLLLKGGPEFWPSAPEPQNPGSSPVSPPPESPNPRIRKRESFSCTHSLPGRTARGRQARRPSSEHKQSNPKENINWPFPFF
jgi:hypothetical protein